MFNVQMLKCSNVQMFKCQMFKCQMFKCSNVNKVRVCLPLSQAREGRVPEQQLLNLGPNFWGKRETCGGIRKKSVGWGGGTSGGKNKICGKKKICGKREDRYLAGLPEVCRELKSVVQSMVKSQKINRGVLTCGRNACGNIFLFCGISFCDAVSTSTQLSIDWTRFVSEIQ